MFDFRHSLLVIVVSFFMVRSTCAIFYRAEKFQLINSQGNVIELFSDVHLPCIDENIEKKQKSDLLKEVKARNALVIAEDMSDYVESLEYKNSITQKYYHPILKRYPHMMSRIGSSDKYKNSILNLIADCRNAGLDCLNVEFRAPLVIFGKEVEGKLLFEDFFHPNSDKVYQEVASYNDSPELNMYYRDLIEREKNFKKPYLNNPDYGLFSSKNNKHVLLDGELIDARIIHQIYKNRHRKDIFICAGGLHISNIIPVLIDMGYREIISEETVIKVEKPKSMASSDSCSLGDCCILPASLLDLAKYFDTYKNRSLRPSARFSTTQKAVIGSIAIIASAIVLLKYIARRPVVTNR